MNWTNKQNLPLPLELALKKNDHITEGDLSVTQMMNPPYKDYLSKKHADDITIDVADNLWSMFGTAMHEYLESAIEGNNDFISEKRYTMKVPTGYGDTWQVSGTCDLYDKKNNIIMDYKTTSVYAVKEPKKEWIRQLNVYAYLARQYRCKVDKLQIIAILKDWSRTKASREFNYPKNPIAIIDIPLYDNDKIWKYIKERVKLHYELKKKGIITICSDEERWKTEDQYRVIKKGNKRATKNFNNEADAEAFKDELESNGNDKYIISLREGVYNRCMGYCNVRPYCKAYKLD